MTDHAAGFDRSRLPHDATSFVGRDRELAEVRSLLDTRRLVTLTGPGGVGKTRLAMRAASEIGGVVWFVDLAPVDAADHVAPAVAAAVGVVEQPDRPPADALAETLASSDAIVVLDNCEQVIAACAGLVSGLLESCPRLRMLATSREALRVPGEAVVAVAPLAVPEGDAAIQTVASVRLFCERAQSANPAFRLTEAGAPSVASICRRLDGLPLAIELAAARVAVLSPEQIDARLDDRFRLLTSPDRTAAGRLRTLRALIDWSYDLLDPTERSLLRRLSVFAGSFDLEGAEAVFGDDALDGLTELVRKSLVVPGEPTGVMRYRLLETIRAYASEKLAESGELHEAGDRLLRRSLQLVGSAGRDEARWLRALDAEHDNIRAALRYARDAHRREELVRLSSAMAPYWELRSVMTEGRMWLELAAEQAEGLAPGLAARALVGAGAMTAATGDPAGARDRFEHALARAREADETDVVADALRGLGNALASLGERSRARTTLTEALEIRRVAGDRRGEAGVLHSLAVTAAFDSELAESRELSERAVAILREQGASKTRSLALTQLAWLVRLQGEAAAARRLALEAAGVAAELGDRRSYAYQLCVLGDLEVADGDLDSARDKVDEALAIARPAGDRNLMTRCLVQLGEVARLADELDVATDLLKEGVESGVRTGNHGLLEHALRELAKVTLDAGDDGGALALARLGFRARPTLDSLEVIAAASARAGDKVTAAELLGWVDRSRTELGAPAPPGHGPRELAVRLGGSGEPVTTAFERGRSLSAAEVRRVALGEEPATDPLADALDAVATLDPRRRSRAPGPARTAPPAAVAFGLRREGDVWRVHFEGRSFIVNDVRGIGFLRVLLANPGREFHALDLTALAAGAPGGRTGAAPEGLSVAADVADPVLDPAARAAFRARIEELSEQIEEAEAWNDTARAERAATERDRLLEELARQAGFRGKDRRSGTAAERARSNVSKALRATIERVASHDEGLGEHLRATVRTGVYCSYTPDPLAGIRWEL